MIRGTTHLPSLPNTARKMPASNVRIASPENRNACPVPGGLMFSSAEEVLRFIAEENVEFVDVRFCDLPGTMQHFTVPAASFGEGVFTDGLMFDGSSIRGLQSVHESDMQLTPGRCTAILDT